MGDKFEIICSNCSPKLPSSRFTAGKWKNNTAGHFFKHYLDVQPVAQLIPVLHSSGCCHCFCLAGSLSLLQLPQPLIVCYCLLPAVQLPHIDHRSFSRGAMGGQKLPNAGLSRAEPHGTVRGDEHTALTITLGQNHQEVNKACSSWWRQLPELYDIMWGVHAHFEASGKHDLRCTWHFGAAGFAPSVPV